MLKPIKRLTDHTDMQLCLFLKEGSEEAFSEIYERYWEKLYSFAFNRLRSHETTFELVQEIFESLWKRRSVIEFHTSLSGYLYASMRYLIVHHIKYSKLKESYCQEFVTFHASLEDNSTEDVVALHDLEDALNRSLVELPKRCQEVFKMSRQQNRSIKEIAEELNISHKTVENQLTAALKYLRTSLGEFMTIVFALMCGLID